MPRKRRYRCACGHSLAYHNIESSRCHARVRAPKVHQDEKAWDDRSPNLYDRTIWYEDVDCRCQQYVGKRPRGRAALVDPVAPGGESIP